MPELTGSQTAMAAGDTNIGDDMPTTQVKMTQQASAAATTRSRPSRSWNSWRSASAAAADAAASCLVGGLSVVKQFQVLGVLLATVRRVRRIHPVPRRRMATPQAAAATTATDMQMLSQRLARGIGTPGRRRRSRPRSPALKDSRERLTADIDALHERRNDPRRFARRDGARCGESASTASRSCSSG